MAKLGYSCNGEDSEGNYIYQGSYGGFDNAQFEEQFKYAFESYFKYSEKEDNEENRQAYIEETMAVFSNSVSRRLSYTPGTAEHGTSSQYEFIVTGEYTLKYSR